MDVKTPVAGNAGGRRRRAGGCGGRLPVQQHDQQYTSNGDQRAGLAHGSPRRRKTRQPRLKSKTRLSAQIRSRKLLLTHIGDADDVRFQNLHQLIFGDVGHFEHDFVVGGIRG